MPRRSRPESDGADFHLLKFSAPAGAGRSYSTSGPRLCEPTTGPPPARRRRVLSRKLGAGPAGGVPSRPGAGLNTSGGNERTDESHHR